MHSRFLPLSAMILLGGLTVPERPLQGSNGVEASEPQDRIEIVGHIPLANDPTGRLLSTQHYNRYYLYAEHADGKGVTVIDVTDAKAPVLAYNTSYPNGDEPDNLLALTGTAALVASPAPARSQTTPQVVRTMSFADPLRPKVTHQVNGVTAIGSDSQRELVFLANGDGIWILRERSAEDSAMLRAYARGVMYDR